jgi:hypothetical protein
MLNVSKPQSTTSDVAYRPLFRPRRKKEIGETKEKKRKEKRKRAKMEEKCLKWHVTGTCTVDRSF